MKQIIIKPGKTIGILGGGQLGRMMAIAAKEMGYQIAVLENSSQSPCGQVADDEVIAAYDDLHGARQLAEVSDVITYEFENIAKETVEWLEEEAYLPQGSDLLSITQDRKLEKKRINEAGVPTAPYLEVDNLNQLRDAIRTLHYPVVLKTARGGYDGKGQVVIHAEDDLPEADKLIENNECILEKWLTFDKELSVIVTRSTTGETVTFPVAENIHVNNILHTSIVPARIPKRVEEEARKVALKLADTFQLIGTLAVELFLTAEGELYVNELAPRPHNSGHYTIDACETSQFEQHIRAICGWPLGKTTLLQPAVMVNILGQHVTKTVAAIPKFANCKLHLYGKSEAKINRKMGHITVLNSVDEALKEIHKFGIWNE